MASTSENPDDINQEAHEHQNEDQRQDTHVSRKDTMLNPTQGQPRDMRKRKFQEMPNSTHMNSTQPTARTYQDNQTSNRYEAQFKGPFIVYITYRDTDNDPEKRARAPKNIGNLHPMSLGMKLKRKGAEVRRIKRIGANLIAVHYDNFEKANELVGKQTTWLETNWMAYIPNFKVSRVGICRGIKNNLSEQKIREGIDWEGKEFEITKIERMTRTKTIYGVKQRVPSNMVKFTFKGQELPDEILIYWNVIKIEPFIARVKTCNKCQRIGHLRWNCRGQPRCNSCGGDHFSKDCTTEYIKCNNCEGNHKTFDESCKELQRAKMINMIAAHRNVEIKDAINFIQKYDLKSFRETNERLNKLRREEGWKTSCQPFLSDWFPPLPTRDKTNTAIPIFNWSDKVKKPDESQKPNLNQRLINARNNTQKSRRKIAKKSSMTSFTSRVFTPNENESLTQRLKQGLSTNNSENYHQLATSQSSTREDLEDGQAAAQQEAYQMILDNPINMSTQEDFVQTVQSNIIELTNSGKLTEEDIKMIIVGKDQSENSLNQNEALQAHNYKPLRDITNNNQNKSINQGEMKINSQKPNKNNNTKSLGDFHPFNKENNNPSN
uniref:CCHC-type domain-containing protein n=1 Tax=Bracon brevicornis TaxID=1563983 RepID=A0A6V7J978_9HYME